MQRENLPSSEIWIASIQLREPIQLEDKASLANRFLALPKLRAD
jgi:hypothetical protein